MKYVAVTVTQTESTKYNVEFVESKSRNMVATVGDLIILLSHNDNNERYCYTLSHKLNTKKNNYIHSYHCGWDEFWYKYF